MIREVVAMPETSSSSQRGQRSTTMHFGALLKMLRNRHGIRQLEVLQLLSGWTQTSYSRLESGELAPPFDQLIALYTALHEAGIDLTAHDRQEFLTLARVRIEVKKSHLDHKTDQEWEALRVTLSQFDHQPAHAGKPSSSEHARSHPKLMETRHLTGREDWLASVLASLEGPLPKKVVVIQGPTGIGKSSEMHRIAQQMLLVPSHPHVILCVLPNLDHQSEPEHTLDLVLGSLLVEIGPPDAASQAASRSRQIGIVLDHLAKVSRPVLICVDNAEHLLDGRGRFAPCWETFLKQFLRSQHHATILLATKEWPGWYAGERAFIAERMIPSLNKDEGVIVMQKLGLAEVAEEHLQRINEAVGGIPLCLEWVASLTKQPLWLDSWDAINDFTESSAKEAVLHRLLDDPVLFRGPIADRIMPLLDRIIKQRLSVEATHVLHILSLAHVPLGKPALQAICPRPAFLKELRDASLLMSYSNRIQLLPMVASTVQQQLTSYQKNTMEEQLITALTKWVDEGSIYESEQGTTITELALLLLKHQRLLEAAQLLTCYGWMSFNLGHASRLAQYLSVMRQDCNWQATTENTIGDLLLNYVLSPYLGKAIDREKRGADHRFIYDAIVTEKVAVWPGVDIAITHELMLYELNRLCFEKAQSLLKDCQARLLSVLPIRWDLHVSLLEKQAWVYTRMCEYHEELKEIQKAKEKREQIISLYKQCITFLSAHETSASLDNTTFKRHLARDLNDLGYHLNRIGQFEEALSFIDHSILLKEQGYAQFGSLAASYGEKAEALMGLGRLQEAVLFDEKALVEVQRCADTGHISSQEEVWIYHVNRGRLYLQLGRVDAAEQLLREALPHIHPRRRMYQLFAKEALAEIDKRRYETKNSSY